MGNLLESLFVHLWNHRVKPREAQVSGGLYLGNRVRDGEVINTGFRLSDQRRSEHIAILGKTGTGKSSLLRNLAAQDIRAGRGFIYFDLHGDTVPYLLRLFAAEERRRRTDLSAKLVVVEPGDTEYSVGLNVLERSGSRQAFVQIAEFSKILKQRWGLEHLGARTEELLRNSLLALADTDNTLLELGALLTNTGFRAQCLAGVQNSEVREYFMQRYNRASEAMQGTVRDPVLNKLTAFTADPKFRHIIGQQRSTFSIDRALDEGSVILLKLDKGRLGEQAATLGSLFLTKIKSALFARSRRELYTVYADEIQNLVDFDNGIDTLLSEARKFGIGVVSANQFLDQYPPQMRAAILSVATHILFQLSSADAEKMSAAMSGSKSVGNLLRNLPQRNMIVKSGSSPWCQVVVPAVSDTLADPGDLYRRCRNRWATRRTQIEAEIQRRQPAVERAPEEVLDDWE